jgi:hypothetical protein
MVFPQDQLTHRVHGMPFAVLSCNTDSKNVPITDTITQVMVNSYINEYKQIHAFIDECHSVIKHALSEDVVVDKRVGRGGNGMYHEPLEQVLLYLGLSMKKNQTVNTSIDGKSVTRAMIPGHPTNANLWFELYNRTLCSNCSARPAKLKECTCDAARYCNNKCQRRHWQTHKRSHRAFMAEKKKSGAQEHKQKSVNGGCADVRTPPREEGYTLKWLSQPCLSFLVLILAVLFYFLFVSSRD